MTSIEKARLKFKNFDLQKLYYFFKQIFNYFLQNPTVLLSTFIVMFLIVQTNTFNKTSQKFMDDFGEAYIEAINTNNIKPLEKYVANNSSYYESIKSSLQEDYRDIDEYEYTKMQFPVVSYDNQVIKISEGTIEKKKKDKWFTKTVSSPLSSREVTLADHEGRQKIVSGKKVFIQESNFISSVLNEFISVLSSIN